MALLSEKEWRFGIVIYILCLIGLFTTAAYVFFSFFPIVLQLIKLAYAIAKFLLTTEETLVFIISYLVSKHLSLPNFIDYSRENEGNGRNDGYWN